MTSKKGFHNPFAGLKTLQKQLAEEEARKAALARASGEAKKTAEAKSRADAARRARDGSLSEEDAFSLAMDGVEPLIDRSARVKPGPTPQARPLEQLDPELAVYDQLRGLVDHLGAGRGAAHVDGPHLPFELSDTDEFIEGAAQGLDPRVLKRLRKGEHAVQAHLDLHGLTRAEAKEALFSFLSRARSEGKRCVLIVHGRGLHSKDQVPVLKESVRRWLGMERFAQGVLAFCTARPADGGAGALYLLLRK